VQVVGMPIKKAFISTRKEDAKRELGLEGKPVVVSAFGSLGAKVMNETMAAVFPMEQAEGFPYHHIHATGSFGWEWMPGKVRENSVDWENCPDLDMREYIYNMPTVMAAADVIISRAGASTCNEIGASGTPCILVPSPNVTNNHQEKNARVLADRGGAVLMLENQCTAQNLWDTVSAILADPQRMTEMGQALRESCILDSAQRICDIIQELSGK
jgi:UDP-N-acetylglucosamine--N-acetylmuramyl-(pentapeptide) pyrophosphoryl-undecaprenol N-acetylglucosamine transferase